MKKQIITLVVSAAVSAPVFAQGSVTLFGIIDEGLNYTNNVGGQKVYELQSGYMQGSRWGLTGKEDLGGGMKAIFRLENGFNLNNGKLGQGGLMFGRQAWVGITDDKFGSVTLGRQYDALVEYFSQTTANGYWGGGLMSHPFDNDNTGNSFRVNNTIRYASPNLSGLQFGGTYSFSNSTGFADNRVYSIGAQYTTGGLLVAAAYLYANNPAANNAGAIAAATDGNFVAERQRIFGTGVNYTFGSATVGLAYTNSDMKNPTANIGYLTSSESILPTTGPLAGGTLNRLRFQNFEVNGKYQFTPAFMVGAEYVYTLENYDATTGSVKPKIHTVGLLADYNVSKRTDVYITGAYQKVAGDRTGSSLDQALVVGAADLSSTSEQFVARVGIRHRF